MIDEQTVTIVSADPSVDKYGDTTTDTPVETDVAGCLVAPRSSTERTDSNEPAVISGFTVYFPPGSELDPADRLRIGGRLYEVEGEAGVWGTAGLEVAVKRWQPR